MKNMAAYKKDFLRITGLTFSLLFGGCAGSQGDQALLDKGSVTAQATMISASNCNLSSTRMGDGGVHRRALESTQTACSGANVQVSGTCENCDSILVSANGTEGTFNVTADGNFSALIHVDSLEKMNLVLTPMINGELGEVFSVDAVSVVSIDSSIQ